ncbi:MAG: 3-isopropylmalate dehydratase large subunit [Bacteroidetes bacterium]|nr:3-isopropylmalate dehydratase large subunit [Bacteroidota bacterium]MBT4411267.1 3-isopropylmalate dehydratase large subunit [Bacteroidota bacterium]
MSLTLIEKIIASHSKYKNVKPGDIVDVFMDVRAARDFGGANVVKNMQDHGLSLEDKSRTFFTFDCNPTGSDQKYAINQHKCRIYAREEGVRVYDIDNGIGTHTLMHEGLTFSGSTAVTTDSHANILGAVGAFGQGMGDQDIAAAWANGKVWFKVPKSAKITLNGTRPEGLSAKDIVLNLLDHFGANSLLGYAVELYGEAVDQMTLDERITIASMGTEMGVITLLFTPNEEVIKYSSERAGREIDLVKADPDAAYEESYELDLSAFIPRVSRPGAPHNTATVMQEEGTPIDSAFIGSCTNGRYEDMVAAADVLKGNTIAAGIVLKIVPATDEIWKQCLENGLIKVFKDSGAMLSNAGCAGCAAGQVGQNGPGEVTISTGNRNFPGKQGKGEVYLASPAVVAASALAGFITDPSRIGLSKVKDIEKAITQAPVTGEHTIASNVPSKVISGRTWYIREDNIDTDMIFHNRYLSITDISEMGQYAFDNLEGYENFAKEVKEGDIIVVQKNFGSGSSRQQAVDCFKALGVNCILAESYGAIYERNAINAAFPILAYDSLQDLSLENGDMLEVNYESGEIKNITKGTSIQANPFSEVQMDIFQKGGLF